MKTIFKKIIDGELEAEKVFENEKILAIKDKFPKAPVHILIMPKKEIASLQKMQKEDLELMEVIIEAAQTLARKFKIENGYRLLTNIGKDGGQEISHLHFHLIGGRPLTTIG